MFTGIIEEIGRIRRVSPGSHSAVLEIYGKKVLEGTKIGDSIAVNGICLTVTEIGKDFFSADVMHETLQRSSLKDAKAGIHVNLERAMGANGRFGGHIVAGHVDGTGKIIKIKKDDNAVWYTIEAPAQILRYIVEKGSITIDGISLTVAKLGNSDFSVSVIPHTGKETTLSERKVGDQVNLENDMIGKYVERLLIFGAPSREEDTDKNISGYDENSNGLKISKEKNSRIDREFLAKFGML